LCQEFGVIAVTDEIYEYILYGGRQHISIGSLAGMEDRTVTISGLGKTYALTGWRVGWTVAHPSITGLIRKVHDYLTICAPSPFQVAGVTALELPDSFYTELSREYDARRKILLSALDAAGLKYLDPQGAYYVMADFAHLDWDRQKYARPGWSARSYFCRIYGPRNWCGRGSWGKFLLPGRGRNSRALQLCQASPYAQCGCQPAFKTCRSCALRLRKLFPT
jgi:histidinol-phosphate/aromatic aminotransferase/cobyric acid decarboxylase-like protein